MKHKNWICHCGEVNQYGYKKCYECKAEHIRQGEQSNYYKDMMALGKEIKKKSGGGRRG